MVPVLFIGGLGRSGTTLLERVLGELPQVTPLGETVHLWRRDLLDDERCGCGVRFSRCPFWTEVGDRAYGGWDAVDVRRVLQLQHQLDRTRRIPRLARQRLDARLHADVWEYVGHYERVYRAAAAASGARLLVDSSKNASLAFLLRWCPAIDLRVLHVVRDSRGVAYSWTKDVPRPESDGQQRMTRYSPSRSAVLWNAHNAAFAMLHRRGVAVRRLRYEELLADPVGTTRDLARWLDLPLRPGDLDYLDTASVRLHACHSAAGNPMRFRTGPLELRRDDDWRTALAPGSRRLVGAMTAPLLGHYGYPLLHQRSRNGTGPSHVDGAR